MPTRTATVVFRIISNDYIRKIDEMTRKTDDLDRATDRLSRGSTRRAARAQETLNRQYRQQIREVQELIRNKRSLAQQTLTLIRNFAGLGGVTDTVISKFKVLAGSAVIGFLIYQMGILGGRLRAVRDYYRDIAREKGIASPQGAIDYLRQATGGTVQDVEFASILAQLTRLGFDLQGIGIILNRLVQQGQLTDIRDINQFISQAFGSLSQGNYSIFDQVGITGTGDDPTRLLDELGLVNSNLIKELDKADDIYDQLAVQLGRLPTTQEAYNEKLRRLTVLVAKENSIAQVNLDNSFIGIQRLRAQFNNSINEASALFSPIINFMTQDLSNFFQLVTYYLRQINDLAEEASESSYNKATLAIFRQFYELFFGFKIPTTAPDFDNTQARTSPYGTDKPFGPVSRNPEDAELERQERLFRRSLGTKQDLFEKISKAAKEHVENIFNEMVRSNRRMQFIYADIEAEQKRLFEIIPSADFINLRHLPVPPPASDIIQERQEPDGSRAGENLTYVEKLLARIGNFISDQASPEKIQNIHRLGEAFEGIDGRIADLIRNIRAGLTSVSLIKQGDSLNSLSGVLGIAQVGINFFQTIFSSKTEEAIKSTYKATQDLIKAEQELARQRQSAAANALQSDLSAIKFREQLGLIETLDPSELLRQFIFGSGNPDIRALSSQLPDEGIISQQIFNSIFTQLYGIVGSENESAIRALQLEIINRQRSIARVEVDARREQAQVIIEEIERQRREVLERYRNAEEAHRQAAIRAVRVRFDLLEVDLRTQYTQRFQQAGGSPSAREVVREDLFRDIDALRQGEASTLTTELNAISLAFEHQASQANQHFDALLRGVELAINDLSLDFDTALQTHVTAELRKLNEAQPGFLEALKGFAPGFAAFWETTIQPQIDELTNPEIDLAPFRELAAATTADIVLLGTALTGEIYETGTAITEEIGNIYTLLNTGGATFNEIQGIKTNTASLLGMDTNIGNIYTLLNTGGVAFSEIQSIKTNSAYLLGIAGNIALIYNEFQAGGNFRNNIGTIKDNIAAFPTTIATALSALTFPTPQVTINQGAVRVSVSVDRSGSVTQTTDRGADKIVTSNPTPIENPPGAPTSGDVNIPEDPNFGGRDTTGPRTPPGFVPGPGTPPRKFPPLV